MGGPIYLRYGDHSYNWGLEHIWQAHFASIPDLPTAISTVSTFVSEILLPGTNILYESGKKSTIVHSATGLVIVEERLDGNNNHFYSVVTAYKRRSAYGYKIGQL